MNIKKFSFSDLSTKKPESAEQHIASDKHFEFFGVRKEVEEPKYTDSDVKKITEDAFSRGYGQAKDEANAQQKLSQDNIETQIFALCNSIVTRVESSIKMLEEQNKIFQQACVQLASKIAKRIGGEALKHDPTENIARIFETSIKEFYHEESVNIKVNPKYIEELNSRFSKIAIQKNFSGKVNFIPDAKIAEFDCVIEWKNSGISLKNEELIQKVDDLITEYCKSIYSKE
jgi:flagellar biosynthesis/type III secretory pathway protein FliH